MDVNIPSTGCSVLNSSTTFYTYRNNDTYRDTYIIYEGKAHLSNTSYNQYGFSYSGTCLQTGDLVYKPEYKEFLFPLFSIVISLLLFYGAYKLMLSHWWRKK